MKSSSFHSSCGLDSSCAHIQSSAGNLAAADSAGTYIQALAGDVPGHSKVAAYCRIMMDGQCIGNCITGIGQTVGRECSAYRCIAGSSQGTEGAGSAINGSAGNGSCRNDIMSIDVAGCSQISILKGSYTVCQFISGDGAGSGQVRHAGNCACGSDVHIADFAGCCCHFAVCIHGELAIGAFDAAVRVEGGLGRRGSIAAGIETVFVHDSTIQAYFDAVFTEGNLVVLALVQNHFIGSGLGGGHIALVINGSGVLLQNIVIAQAHSAVDGFHQFGIRCFTACQFLGICLVQGRESISHILIDGIEPIHHILVNLFNDLVLGCISPDPGGGFFGQSSVQVGDVFANGVGRFHNGPILYGRISLAHIILGSLVFQIFLHIGNAVIQGLIAGFTGCGFVVDIGLELLICFFQIGNRIFALTCFFINGIGIGFGLRIEGNDIFAYRIAGRYIIPAGKGIIHDRSGADIARSVDAACGNSIAFNGGRGRRSSIIISKGCPGRFSSSNLGIFSCSISCSINNLSI
ncbi:MAG: hypothetical protein PUJ22_06905 [Mitsuokella jalaludinii]|uniref:hypothetical protein n=1 Tax=Mitsuokella jalaludinii TaxID=187979 RepID=UPI00242F680D|nr:hypothetical protein [Mitsuokella jalaludinii]MDD7745847.1 hypothetical protein [Mitsuokella jalaludinii]